MASKERLLTALRGALDEAGRQWLVQALGRAETGSLDELLTVYTAASRRMGNGPLPTPADGPAFEHWTLEDAARVLLLLTRAGTSPATFREDAVACYEQGDAREQRSWLRAIGTLPDPEQFLAAAVDACRSSILPIFEAIACENPYPSRYFPERNFNQMVLKALFSGVALSRVVGLDGTPECRVDADGVGLRRRTPRRRPFRSRRYRNGDAGPKPAAGAAPMKIFDPHVHMTSRTTDDYEAMAGAGIVAVVEPAFWLGPAAHERRQLRRLLQQPAGLGALPRVAVRHAAFLHHRAESEGSQQPETLCRSPRADAPVPVEGRGGGHRRDRVRRSDRRGRGVFHPPDRTGGGIQPADPPAHAAPRQEAGDRSARST